MRYNKSFGGLRLILSLTTSTPPAPVAICCAHIPVEPWSWRDMSPGNRAPLPTAASCPWLFLSCIITASLFRAQLCRRTSCPGLVYALSLVKREATEGAGFALTPLTSLRNLGTEMSHAPHCSLLHCRPRKQTATQIQTRWSSFCTQIEKMGKSTSNSTLGEFSHDHPTPTAHVMLLRDVFEHCQAEEGINLHLPLPGREDIIWNTTLSS